MGVRLNPGGHPHHHTRMPVIVAAQLFDASDLVQGINHDVAHAVAQGQRQLVTGLVVAVHPDPCRVHAAGEGDLEFPT